MAPGRSIDGFIGVRQDGYDVPGVELIVPASQQETLWAQLGATGAVMLADTAAYTARRVELGRPAPGAELTGEYSPLEAGLAWACAENKGCYTGQEIIARQITYDKVTRTLVGLRSDMLLERGAPVTADGREVGVVTSAALSPTEGRPLALAVIKRPYSAPGAAVAVGDQPAAVVELPFVA